MAAGGRDAKLEISEEKKQISFWIRTCKGVFIANGREPSVSAEDWLGEEP